MTKNEGSIQGGDVWTGMMSTTKSARVRIPRIVIIAMILLVTRNDPAMDSTIISLFTDLPLPHRPLCAPLSVLVSGPSPKALHYS